MANPGDKIKITTKDTEIEGILMPNETEESIFIKLDNGYNIGIEKKKILKTHVTEPKHHKKEEKKHLHEKKGNKKIIILHTGGTIASKVDYETGGVIAKFSAEDIVEMVPELAEIANIETEVVASMMSEDMNFDDFKKIIHAIKKNIGKCDGIIVGHGTDTLGYSAAAAAFSLENINIPVIFVGSQRSSDRGSSDAAINLICAAHFIAGSDFKGVTICMHNSSNDEECAILPATKTRKMHTSRRDAFKAINDSPIALINSKTGKITFLKKNENAENKEEYKFISKDNFSEKVALIKVHPNFSLKLLEFICHNYDAIVFEATGLGHLPTNTESNLKNYEILQHFIKKGGIVAITSQCLYGRVHPNVYANLRRLSEIGCIFCEDMLPETAYVKLSWLLGNYSKEEAKELLAKNLRGEITERTLYKDDYLE